MLAFLGWCASVFRTDITQARLAPVFAAWDAVLLAAALSLCNYALRALRWVAYLRRLGHRLPAGFTVLTYFIGFAFTLSPGKVGEMVRAGYYREHGVPLSSTGGAFFVERLMDLAAMLTLALLAVVASTDYDILIWGAIVAVAGLLAMLTLLPWAVIGQRWQVTADRRPTASRRLVGEVLQGIVSAQVLLSPSLLTFGFGVSLLAWLCEGIGLKVIDTIVPVPPLAWSQAVGIYSIAVIVGALSFLPGGLGSTEAVMVALLSRAGCALPDAILLTLVCRLLTLWFAVVIGWLALLALRRHPLARAAAAR